MGEQKSSELFALFMCGAYQVITSQRVGDTRS